MKAPLLSQLLFALVMVGQFTDQREVTPDAI